MGIVVGVIIDVTVTMAASAAEAAATAAAAEVAAAAADAEVEVAALTETEAEAAALTEADAADDAVKNAVSDVLAKSTVAKIVLENIAKFSGFIKEFCAFDAVFKTADGIICTIEGSSSRFIKLDEYVKVLVEMKKSLEIIKIWLEKHSKDYVTLDGIDIKVESGLLVTAMKPLIAGIGNLKRLSIDVDTLNADNNLITDAQIDSLRRGLVRMNRTFEKLAMFMNDKKKRFRVLASFPELEEAVKNWKAIIGDLEMDVKM